MSHNCPLYYCCWFITSTGIDSLQPVSNYRKKYKLQGKIAKIKTLDSVSLCMKTQGSPQYMYFGVEFLNRLLKYVIIMAKMFMRYCDLV